jgi:hypothetical protein
MASGIPPRTPTEFPEFDILEYASIMVPCDACGDQLPVSLREVLDAQERLHAGCTSQDERECPSLTHAALAEESALRDLARSWRRVMSQVEATGFDVAFRLPRRRH